MIEIQDKFSAENQVTLHHGDCVKLLKSIPDAAVDLIVTSPPYCMGKPYERQSDDLKVFLHKHKKILPEIYRVLKDGGSMCWQVGYHVKNNVVTPLDFVVHEAMESCANEALSENLILRNRLIWTFGHGHNAVHRFSGRHEVILWYTKGSDFKFNLDDVRIPQKYPGKRHYKGEKRGEYSGNPLGKNPSDVWDIPNVKANHIEKTEHPCQFPVVIPQRLIKALTNRGDLVLDPFMGSGTVSVASTLEGRRFVGAETEKEYYEIAYARIQKALAGTIKFRRDEPVRPPNPHSSVAMKPKHFM